MHTLVRFVVLNSVAFITGSEGRVFCEDVNSSPWIPLGPSCPVTCTCVIAAIERLKTHKYNKILERQDRLQQKTLLHQKSLPANFNMIFNMNKTFSQTPSLLYVTYNKALRSGVLAKIIDKIKMADEKGSYSKNSSCSYLQKKLRFKYSMVGKRMFKDKCSRRSLVGGRFANIFAENLNMYIRSEFKFTPDMITVLFKRLLGKDIDLHNSASDVSSVIDYVSNAVQKFKSSNNEGAGYITLKNRDCTNIHISGCFCMRGYVEKDAKCAKPKECLNDYPDDYKIYLDKIRFN